MKKCNAKNVVLRLKCNGLAHGPILGTGATGLQLPYLSPYDNKHFPSPNIK